MSIAARMTRCPDPFDPELGAEAVAAVPGLPAELAGLVAGTAGCSPYLQGLIQREAAWLPAALDDPEAARTELLDGVDAIAPDALMAGLRQTKRRLALLTALTDLSGVWPLEEVTGTLTRFAFAACERAIRAGLTIEAQRRKLPGYGVDDLQDAAGWVALAMGKMGAGELNYSSDIDLICLFDETRFERDVYFDARQAFVRATRKMTALLSENTADGYVFRTDLRLRPDPSVTPVCLAMESAERYYESLGRTWERAAYIKATPCAGDLAGGARFLKALKPFIWRKHLDFAAIQDAHDMRLRIREHKGLTGPITLAGHDMKLGRGGIREIEFFTQTRQIIAGGRDPDLRVKGTVEGLHLLADKGWIAADNAEALAEHYRFHREVEHRVQMIRDAQTHALPGSDEGFRRLAMFMGRAEDGLRAELLDRLTDVHARTEGFFAPDSAAVAAPADIAPIQFDTDLIARWPGYPALRSDRAVEIFERLKPDFLARLSRAAKPSEALVAFDGFLAGLPAGVQVFSLFEANPQLIELLVDTICTAPALGLYLSRNSQVFDAVIGGDFFADWPGKDQLSADLAARLSAEPDYERQLDLARRWAKEWHFRIGVHHLRGLVDARKAARQYADLADAVLSALWPVVVDSFAIKHGAPPGRGAMVLGMGSLGAKRLHATSDLDLIVIYDSAGVEASDGRRPLASRMYYARLTQALVTALSAPMSEGRLYEVDMRLRPSGKQGPVATSWDSFRSYQRTEAWTWEHLALTRARPIVGPPALMAEVEDFRRELLAAPRNRADVLTDVATMRARIADAKGPEGALDAKIGAGRLQDIELLAQVGNLLSGQGRGEVAAGLDGAIATGLVDAEGKDNLSAAYDLCWRVQLASKLLSQQPLDADALGQGARAYLARSTDTAGLAELVEALHTVTSAAGTVIDAALPRPSEE